jgi:hypothetical protein
MGLEAAPVLPKLDTAPLAMPPMASRPRPAAMAGIPVKFLRLVERYGPRLLDAW